MSVSACGLRRGCSPNLPKRPTMLVDGRSIDPGAQLRADVCVVGAGPAGLTAARELTAAGRRVLVLEAGGQNEEGHGELLQATVDVTGLRYFLRSSRRCAVEGSAPLWFVEAPHGGRTLRLRELDRVDFAARPWLGLKGWPLGPSDLRSFYQRARGLFGLPQLPDDAWGHWDTTLLESPLAPDGSDLETKPFDFGSRDLFLESTCRAVTRSDEVTVVHDAPVLELRCDDSPEKVSSAVCLRATDATFSVDANEFVVAGGGIENARLLLASRSRHSRGIGNAHDLVGRFFMEHPVCSAAIVLPRPGSPLADATVHAIHDHRGRPVQRKYGLREAAAERAESGNHLFFFQSATWSPRLLALLEGENLRDRRQGARLLRQAVRARALPEDLADFAREGIRSLGYPFRRASLGARLRTGRGVPDGVGDTPMLLLQVMAEQLPNPNSRVTLTGEGAKPPRAQLDWRVQPGEWRGLARATRMLSQWLEPHARVLQLVPQDGSGPPQLAKADHHMGTTRMDPDPHNGVVDIDCRVHGMANLYVAGSSVFPTGGGANPTLTILALTLRLTDRLARS